MFLILEVYQTHRHEKAMLTSSAPANNLAQDNVFRYQMVLRLEKVQLQECKTQKEVNEVSLLKKFMRAKVMKASAQRSCPIQMLHHFRPEQKAKPI